MSDTPSPLRTRLSHDLRRAMKERDKVTHMLVAAHTLAKMTNGP